jgi:hypothetical protein
MKRRETGGNTQHHGDNVDIPDGKIDRPPHSVTHKQAPKATGKGNKTGLGP